MYVKSSKISISSLIQNFFLWRGMRLGCLKTNKFKESRCSRCPIYSKSRTSRTPKRLLFAMKLKGSFLYILNSKSLSFLFKFWYNDCYKPHRNLEEKRGNCVVISLFVCIVYNYLGYITSLWLVKCRDFTVGCWPTKQVVSLFVYIGYNYLGYITSLWLVKRSLTP